MMLYSKLLIAGIRNLRIRFVSPSGARMNNPTASVSANAIEPATAQFEISSPPSFESVDAAAE